MLTELLDMQGLRLGIDYDVQQTLTDEKGNIVTNTDSGKKMIPDVILHYPMNEDVVVDSKMSIDAYYQYANTDNETLNKNMPMTWCVAFVHRLPIWQKRTTAVIFEGREKPLILSLCLCLMKVHYN
jgi:hypothetical protein